MAENPKVQIKFFHGGTAPVSSVIIELSQADIHNIQHHRSTSILEWAQAALQIDLEAIAAEDEEPIVSASVYTPDPRD